MSWITDTLAVLCLSVLKYASTGQIPIPPIFSPCEFPSPLIPETQFYDNCGFYYRMNKLPWLCDLQRQLMDHGDIYNLHQTYMKYSSVFLPNNKSNLAVALVRHLEPMQKEEEGKHKRYSCLRDFHECTRSEASLLTQKPDEITIRLINDIKLYMKVYAWKLYDRWFAASDQNCHAPQVLVLIVVDGMLNSAQKIPYVRIHSGAMLGDSVGDERLRKTLANIEMETTNAIVQNLPTPRMLTDMLVDVGNALLDWREAAKDHSVPRWAKQVFAVCIFLVVLALAVEWYIVRRKLAVKKSPSGIKIVSGKSKTHLMF